MSKYAEAAQILKREASRYEALMAAAAALDEIGSFEQAAAEQQAAANTAKKAAEKARAELAGLVEQIAQAKDRLQITVQNGATAFAQTVAETKEQIAAMLAMAEQQVVQLKEKAVSDAAKAVSETTRLNSAASAEYTSLVAQIAKLKENARTASDEAEASEKRLAKVKANIASLVAGQ